METINSTDPEELNEVDPKEVKGIDTSTGEPSSQQSDDLGRVKEEDFYTPGKSAVSRISGTAVDIGASTSNLSVDAAAAAQFTAVDLAKGIRDPNERTRFIKEQGSKMADLMNGVVGIKFDDEIVDYSKFRQKQYDTKVAKLLDDLDENQGFLQELGNFSGKLLGKTAVAVSGIIPAVFGIANAIVTLDASKLYDNSAFDTWGKMDKALDEYFVVYGGDSYTAGEQKHVFARFMDNPMKSLADDFAPTIAFVAGAVGTSYITGGISNLQAAKGLSYINGLSKGLAKTNLVYKNGIKWARGIKNFEDVAQYAGFVQKYSKGLGTINQMILSASYESALIAKDTRNSTILNSKINYIKDNPQLAAEYDALVRKHMDEFGNMDKTQEELVEELSAQIPKYDLNQIEYAGSQAGNLAFFTNVPLVGASNLIQFSKAFNTSYRTGQNLISKGAINPLRGVVTTAEGKLATAASQASKFDKVVGYTAIALKPGLTEAFEEFSQGVIEKGYSDYYSLEYKDGAIQDTKSFLNSVTTQAALYANSVEGFDSVALGFLMGMVGLPLGIRQDAETGKTKIGFGFTGGIKEAIQEFNAELKKTDNAVEHYNEGNFNEVLKNNLNAVIKQMQIQKNLDKFAEEENIFEYKNAEFQSIYNFIENRIKNEIGETVFQDIDAIEKMTLEEFNEQFAFKEDNFQFTEETKKKAVESMRSTAESIFKAHEDVNNVINYKRGFIDKLFKTKFEGLSNEDGFITESLTDQMKFLYASGLNLRKREEELTKRVSDLTKGKLNVSELGVKLRERVEKKTKDGKTVKEEDTSGYLSQELAGIDPEKGKAVFADQVAELKKMIKDQIKFDRETEIEYNKNSVEIDQIVEDIVKLRDMESKTWEIYKTLFTPKGAKKFAEIKAQLIIHKAIKLQQEQAEQQKEELNKKKSSESVKKTVSNANSTNNNFIVEEKLQEELQEIDSLIQEEKEKQLKNQEEGKPEQNSNLALKILEILSTKPVVFAKIKEIAENSDEYESILSNEAVDLLQGFEEPSIQEEGNTAIRILSQLIKSNKEALSQPNITLDYANEEDTKPFANQVNPSKGSTKENHQSNTVKQNLLQRLEKLKEEQGDDYVEEGTTSSDKTTILLYSDKVGKTGIVPDGKGGYVTVNQDMPITEKSNKKVNDGNFLTNQELRENNVRATFRLAENEYNEKLKEEGNFNENTVAIDVYHGDTFIGRLPGSTNPTTPTQLKNLRKALFKQFTDEAVDQEAPGVYTGYQATVTPKTEFEKKNERRLNKHKTDLKEATTVKEKAQAISNFKKHKAALEQRGGTISKEDTALFDSAEQELNKQGIKIDGIKVGDTIKSGTILEISNVTDPDDVVFGGLDADFTIQEVITIVEPQIVTEGKQTQRAKVDVKVRAKTKEELESNVASLTQQIKALKNLGKDTSVEEKLLEKFNNRLDQINESRTVSEKREASDKQATKNAQIAFDAKVIEEYSKITSGFKEDSKEKFPPRTLEEALRELESFLEKTFGWKDVRVIHEIITITEESVETTVNEFSIELNDPNAIGDVYFKVRGTVGTSGTEANPTTTFLLPLNKINNAKHNKELKDLKYVEASENIFNAALKEGIITESEGMYSYEDTKLGETGETIILGKTKESIIELLKYNPNFAEEINNKLETSQVSEISEADQNELIGPDGEVIQTTEDTESAPETEVEQTAREKVIQENFEDIIKALTANPIVQGEEFIGEKKCD